MRMFTARGKHTLKICGTLSSDALDMLPVCESIPLVLSPSGSSCPEILFSKNLVRLKDDYGGYFPVNKGLLAKLFD
ncbi:MAG: hypothetical protein KGI04_01225 [Candidatus Micrarchaeota archaeon]|nr:hypothetical protein [Candidatus Micrarchaeota archaeon]